MITLIFRKTLRVSSSAARSTDAEAITLMSADIDRIGSSLTKIHQAYASFLEIGLALWFLYRLLGVATIAPIGWIVGMLILPATFIYKGSYSTSVSGNRLPCCHCGR